MCFENGEQLSVVREPGPHVLFDQRPRYVASGQVQGRERPPLVLLLEKLELRELLLLSRPAA
jgi:hypothetical protein